MNELLFKSSIFLSRAPFCFQSQFTKSFGHSFSNIISSPIVNQRLSTPVRWATSSTPDNSSKKTQTRQTVYPELDQPLKKARKFDPVANIKKFPDEDFDFDSLKYQKQESETSVDQEEIEEDEREREFRRMQREKAKVVSGRINFDTDINITKWSENSYKQLLDSISDQKKNILITKASLIALKNFLKKGETHVDLHKEVYQYGKHRPKDYSFQRNFPHSFYYEPDPALDYPAPPPEPTAIQVKTVLSYDDDPVSTEEPPFKLPAARRLPNGSTFAVGRRKAAIASCYLSEGVGKITVNKRPLDEYFRFDDRRTAMRPLTLTETETFFDLNIQVKGGGITGQADAIKFAISRCILKYDPQYWWVLHGDRLLQGDRRRVEPKKYGRHKARRGNQWVKR